MIASFQNRMRVSLDLRFPQIEGVTSALSARRNSILILICKNTGEFTLEKDLTLAQFVKRLMLKPVTCIII